MGPAFGGGHGWLQGRYGLGVDNSIIEAHVVLAYGSLITSSEDPYPDMFWELRGAGHNSGIEKVGVLFNLLTKLGAGGKHPGELLNFSFFLRLPDFDPNNAVAMTYLIFGGTEEAASRYLSQLSALGPVSGSVVLAASPELPSLTQNGLNDIACQDIGYSALRFPVSVKTYNVTAQQAAFDYLNDIMKIAPGLNNSLFINEGYTLKAVQAVASESTAYPDRFNNLLLSPVLIYLKTSLDEHAIEAEKHLGRILLEGSGFSNLYAYVNYAHGDQTIEELYGHEAWRIQKLESLNVNIRRTGSHRSRRWSWNRARIAYHLCIGGVSRARG
ncbi:hypothetical protein BJ170DRAFT_725845 [Xylariales sp. AK1849]|nr:hypothetical protein BJ170DRAFT_725845 [Xylariales sp. AK1849]